MLAEALGLSWRRGALEVGWCGESLPTAGEVPLDHSVFPGLRVWRVSGGGSLRGGPLIAELKGAWAPIWEVADLLAVAAQIGPLTLKP